MVSLGSRMVAMGRSLESLYRKTFSRSCSFVPDGTWLAGKCGVSRQIIVQDIALMRAENKNILSQMVHLYQIEALNSWEHITQDLPRDFREIERSQGKEKADR